MNANAKPVLIASALISETGSTFSLPDKRVQIEIDPTAISRFLEKCDGSQSLEEIVTSLSDCWDSEDLYRLASELQEIGIVQNSCTAAISHWLMVKNPTPFTTGITDQEISALVEKARRRHAQALPHFEFVVPVTSFGELLRTRKSVRHFTEKAISIESLTQLMWAAYGEVEAVSEGARGRRTVPSPGALYPIHVSLVLLRATEVLDAGIYNVHLHAPERVGFTKVSADIPHAMRAFADPLMLEVNGPAGIIVLSGSLIESARKYGNRSLLYVPLEIGHVAQNAHLAAQQLGLATVEIGGFMEDLLASALHLPSEFIPMTTILFGFESDPVVREDPLIELEWTVPTTAAYDLPFHMAFARLAGNVKGDWSCGRSPSARMAQIKATSEAREWAACGFVPDSVARGRLNDYCDIVDPREIVGYLPEQYADPDFPFKPFDPAIEYSWADATDAISGKRVKVLADCVYFPFESPSPRYTHASSSGVAAHPVREQAFKSAVLELIERDSFMATYLNRLEAPTVEISSLPLEFRHRLKRLEDAGFRVWIKDLTLEFAPVVFVIAQSEEHTYTTCSGCCGFDPVTILDHALMEVESSVHCRLADGQLKKVSLTAVREPADHDRLYGQPEHYRQADFLMKGPVTCFSEFGKRGCKTWEHLLHEFRSQNFQILSIPMEISGQLGGNANLHIIRAIIPGLIPISFGYGEEPLGVPRVRKVATQLGVNNAEVPALPLFPHPYI